MSDNQLASAEGSDYDKLSHETVSTICTVTSAASSSGQAPQGEHTAKLPTRKEWKNLMRLYFTVRHPRVIQCGHTLDIDREPRNHCEGCWFAFFNKHGELVNTADEVFRTYGPQGLTKLRGEKFTKNFKRFMATLAKWKEEQEKDATKAGPSSDGGAPVPVEQKEGQ